MAGKDFLLSVLLASTLMIADAWSQQPQNFGPSPYGGPPFPEFVVPPGALNGLVAVSTPSYTIVYDIGQVQQAGGFGSAFFRFTRAHEYAHLRLNHVKKMPSPQVYYDNELEADCEAAQLFRWGSAEVSAAVFQYKKKVPAADTPSMPGYLSRIQTMQQCG